ncbi:MAG TPA: DMT family transporter [Rectinemataceae bacterium]|nr:DMT family transporter [Rectinemataceae bacterium]
MARPSEYLAGIGYASIFGLSFLVTKGSLEVLAPFELLFLRFALAALILGALALFRVIKLDFRGKSLGNLTLACLFQPFLYFIGETFGVRDSASSTAGLVIGVLPAVGTILGAIMLGEAVGLLQGLFLGLSVLGVGAIALFGGAAGGETGSPAGFAFLLGAVGSAALYNIFSRRSSRVFTPIETTFAMMWSGAILFGLLAVLGGAGAFEGSFARGTGFGPELLSRAWKAAPGIVYLGALSSVLAFFFINFTLSRLRVSQSIVFSNLTTVISVAAGVLIRGEPFGIAQLAGSAMIVAGVWGTNAFAGRRRAEKFL